jgi:hypothetical protein
LPFGVPANNDWPSSIAEGSAGERMGPPEIFAICAKVISDSTTPFLATGYEISPPRLSVQSPGTSTGIRNESVKIHKILFS